MNKNDLITTVNNAKRGDKKAFETLYSEYYSNLYFFVLKNVKNKETAEDITQEAFLKAMKSLETLARPETFETWLHSIAYNKCMDNFRAESRNACFETDEEKEQAIENSALNSPVMLPEDYAVNEDRKRELADLIDRLKPDMRSTLILYYYNDMSISEVASSLGMNENAAKQKLFQARKKLRAQIEKLYGKGAVLAAVPMRDMIRSTITPKYAAAKASATAVGTGFLAGKIAGVSAAAVFALGLPIGLGMAGKNGRNGLAGDARPTSSTSYIGVSYEENGTADKNFADTAENVTKGGSDNKADSKTDSKFNTLPKAAEPKTAVPTSTVSGEPVQTTPSADNSKTGKNAAAASEKKTDTPDVSDNEFVGKSYNELKALAGTQFNSQLYARSFVPYISGAMTEEEYQKNVFFEHTVFCTAVINGSKWHFEFELTEDEYNEICSDIGSFSKRGWEREVSYGRAFAYVDLSKFDPACLKAMPLPDDTAVEPVKGRPEMSVTALLTMSVDQLKDLTDNDYEIVLSSASQCARFGLKCSYFPSYVFILDTTISDYAPADSIKVKASDFGIDTDNDYALGNTITQLELFEGASIREGLDVGMSYSQIRNALGTDLSIHRINNSLGLGAAVEVDGRTWVLHFDLTDGQRKAVNEAIDQQIDALNAKYGDGYVTIANIEDITVDLGELGFDPTCDIAVYSVVPD
ncbi:RNA polymerase sigma factor, sigma-70 family [Ruminococcus sp. YE71]|uniref:RNA polymerase sigma factor n=1 Tax=unclassified Ruminococcus TaxID=2608920 RepID=UPI0008801AC5|nr:MULTISPECIES: RNA polymerase sigma factor [unclassified Ruminococcus]SDA26922.1 RNA polymerase sigma factor, sigma-70 family [Ruminococcus sp. YE78]SFW44686.1 RNA polymerase sigma factor, sigma-70 family [Ruminococcus sp. YE71]